MKKKSEGKNNLQTEKGKRVVEKRKSLVEKKVKYQVYRKKVSCEKIEKLREIFCKGKENQRRKAQCVLVGVGRGFTDDDDYDDAVLSPHNLSTAHSAHTLRCAQFGNVAASLPKNRVPSQAGGGQAGVGGIAGLLATTAMLDPSTGGLRVPPGRQLWAPHPAPTEAAAVYSLFQQEHQQHQTLVATPHRFATPNTAATYPCGTAALLASVHPQKDVITSNYSPITLKPKLAKKRSWDDVVKVEPAPAKSPCSCPNAVKKVETAASSRSTPVSLSLVKKEPIGTPTTPCQVAEVTTSVRVKQEISESSITTGASGIPVGIAVARQRNLDNGRSRGETPPTAAHHVPPPMAQPTILQPPPLLLAGCDDRSMWSMPHTGPHWQYPPMEPSIPVGFQLVRDPMTGQLLLIPPTNVGVMLPCDMTSAAKTTHVSSAHQPLLASNPGLTLIQQLSTLANPTQFSTGSLLIQHISGSNTVPHTLLPHQSTGSVLISTQQLNTEPPQLINTATAHAQHSTAVMQLGGNAALQPSPTAAQQCSSAAVSHQLTESHVTTSTSTTLMTQSHTPAQITLPQPPPPQQQLTQQATNQQQQQPSVNTLSISTTTTTTTVQQESLAVSADLPAAHAQSAVQPNMTSQIPAVQPDVPNQQAVMTSAVASQPQAIVATVAPVQLHAETQCGSDDNDSQPDIVVEKKSQGTSPVSCLNGYSGDELDATSDCDVADESQDATFQDAGNQTESLSPAIDNAPETPFTTNGDSVDTTSCSTVADKVETSSCTPVENSCTTEATSCSSVATSCSTDDSKVEAQQLNSCSTVETTVVDDTMQLNGLELLSYSIEKFATRLTSASVDNQTDCNQIALEKVVSIETDNGASVKSEIEMEVKEEDDKEEGGAFLSETAAEEDKDTKEEFGRKFDGLSLLLSALAHQRDVESEDTSSLEPKKESTVPAHRRMMPKFTKPPQESTSAVCTVSPSYKSTDSDEEFRRLIATSKKHLLSSSCDQAEQSMRSQLAELRKLYREKQRELSKLSPTASSSIRRFLRRSRPGRRPRGGSTHNSSETASDKDKSVERLRSTSPKAREGDLSPPVLEPWSALPHCSDSRIPPVLTPSSNQLTASDATLQDTPRTPRNEWTYDRDTACKSPPTLSPIASSLPPHSSSSKKRKVGRPKKRDDHHHHHHNHHHHHRDHHRDDSPPVAKKARCSKNALVGLLLGPGAKNRIAQMATAQHSPTPTPAANDVNKPHKIRPKLKAEVKMKLWCEEEDGMEWTNISEESKMTSPLHMKFAHRRSSVPPEGQSTVTVSQQPTPKLAGNGMRRPVKSKSLPGVQAKANKLNKEKQAAQVMHKRRSLPAMSSSNQKTSEISPICISMADLDTVECRLTVAALEAGLPRRVLVAKGGLLYAGELAEIQAPDLYSITLDGERAHRPHIYTQEEVLNDILQEVKLSTPPKQGTRLCAFWSQQYRCLYPGTVSSNQYADQKFVCVEFDDGDDGRISLDDIRLLPHDYPVVEYDPNPLLTLGKRKRRISTASSEHSTKTYVTAEHTLDGSLEEVDEEEIHERDAAIAEDDIHKTIEGEEEEEDEEEDDNEEETEIIVDVETVDVEPEDGGEKFEVKKDEEQNVESDNEKKLKNKTEEESKEESSGICVDNIQEEKTQQTANVPSEEEKERRRLKKKRREKHRLETEGREEDGVGVVHKKKKKHRECCNKPHHHHKHKHHKHRHHKHRHSYGSETNKEEGDENRMSQTKVTEGRSIDRPHSKPLQADTTNTKQTVHKKQHRDRQNSVEGAKSKMAAFLPAKQLWQWLGKGYKRPGAKGRCRKEFYKSIHRQNETISVGDCAVFLSTGRPDRPFIGRIESMWSSWTHNMVVKVKWFYHPEETAGCPDQLTYPGALFESPHNDENDVQTISHKCEVLNLGAYKDWLSGDPERVETIYEHNDIYYLAGYYDPTTLHLTFEPGVI
ncbi:hypothetical protein LSTR_LSTR002588 [Laodelphax striatellus]|uniref:BAH domain-containing protein n=1 Tax=Laodelphax striatellus TaxID=195883 RepID=A0A482XKV9_LAOST|nr:hypothetical protein LSTR_LSTR002588 [Laodelphax striatellus]